MAHQVLTQDMTDAEFDHHVMAILARELGPGGFARYLMLHRSGHGDYTAERHQWLGHLTLEEIWRDMEAQGLTQKV
jgi:hypothetical protein